LKKKKKNPGKKKKRDGPKKGGFFGDKHQGGERVGVFDPKKFAQVNLILEKLDRGGWQNTKNPKRGGGGL